MDRSRFAAYVAEACRANGCRVEPPAPGPDAGPDAGQVLIVVTGAGDRVAVRPECHYGPPVGEGPVRAAHAARLARGCHRAAVVTNNTFAPDARAAAAADGTVLIDESQLRGLIRGRVKLCGENRFRAEQ
jgi:hypothetical protein